MLVRLLSLFEHAGTSCGVCSPEHFRGSNHWALLAVHFLDLMQSGGVFRRDIAVLCEQVLLELQIGLKIWQCDHALTLLRCVEHIRVFLTQSSATQRACLGVVAVCVHH